ncbi:MAG: Vitamin K epoxide reductase [Candidatus Woesebacteria bacterium GW2011_GWB1_43_14]|uniref:Vitamin K epoxide reductase n=1 Tax=Candidatus Woesebacteria bacterium GW2011_GWB1_43_14 TaxID=1618578 RepID=A0A0G1GDP3_9BACT|nr:MAG: protein of unknown function with transmembrane region [Candidatus Woesebacteria bacterium GW2011_GWC1_42_9]KKS96998.1 MAG: Vitamin K epoxide reductase [Candidatus Woesebacteria bacterium GW2011_GWB1_43_14]
MTSLALIFTLAAIGVSETRYLIEKRLKSDKPACFLGSECHIVLESKYNKLLGIHNDVWGLVFYLLTGFIVSLLVLRIGSENLIQNLSGIMLFSGSLVSVYFVFLQKFVIKKWCFWCVMSAVTIWLMALIYLFI